MINFRVYSILFLISWLMSACATNNVAVAPSSNQLDQNLNARQIEMAGFKEAGTASRDLPGYRPLKRVLIMFANDDRLKHLQKLAPGVEFVGSTGITPDESVNGQFDAVILVCGVDAALEFAENVAWVHSYSAGVESCLAHATLQSMNEQAQSYIVTNSSGTAASIIGEHAIAMMMSFTRGLHHFRDAQNRAEWSRSFASETNLTTTIADKTILILGLGSIGKEIAKRAHALGMRVTATRNSSRSGPEYVDYVGLANETLKLARQADVIVNALPLTDSTRGFLNADFFNAMKETGLFVSVGRGATTNTEDLLEALRAGKLAGAALDVTDPEPLPANHPLWAEKNVIITPHLAGTGGNGRARVFDLLQENIRRYVAGEPLLNLVNTKAGY